MKYFVFIFAFLFAAEIFAQESQVRYYKVQKAQFAREHVQAPTSAFFFVDFQQNSVTLQINQAMPHCPRGLVCPQALPLPIMITLPILSLDKDDCGALIISAGEPLSHQSPVQRRIHLLDYSHSFCPSQMNLDSTARYETELLGRSGLESLAISSMVISPVEDAP